MCIPLCASLVVEAVRSNASAALFVRNQKSGIDFRLQSKDAGDVALFELRNQVRGPVQNRLIDVRPEKEPNKRVLFFSPKLGPCVHRALSLLSCETSAETRALATKSAFAIDKEHVAQMAASGADQCQVAGSPAPLQPELDTSRRRQPAVLGENDHVDVGCVRPVAAESAPNVGRPELAEPGNNNLKAHSSTPGRCTWASRRWAMRVDAAGERRLHATTDRGVHRDDVLQSSSEG